MVRVSENLSRVLTVLLAGGALACGSAALSGCSAGSSTGLAAPTVSQPGSGASPGTDKSVNALETIDSAALKAPRLAIFLTAAPAKPAAAVAGFTHVWAPILKIELLDEASTAQTLWDGGTTGTMVDLSTLAGTSAAASSRFLGIIGAPVNAGKPTVRVRITFGKSFELFAPGESVARTVLLDDNIARDSESRPTISYNLSRARDLSTGKENLVIGFDLNAFGLKDDKITPALQEGDSSGIKDLTRQVESTFDGTIAGITTDGAAAKFVLTPDSTSCPPMIVETSASTALYNTSADSSPTLASKQRVSVRGILSPESKRIVAAEIATTAASDKSAAPGAISALIGAVSHASAEDQTLVVSASQVNGITPTQAAITVSLAKDAVLRTRGGLLLKPAEFWDKLKDKNGAALLRVDGVYDPVTGTLTASRAKFEGESLTATHEADAEGDPKFVDIGAKSFTIASPLIKWDGILAPDDKSKGISVSITPATVFVDATGAALASAHFYEAATKDKDKVVRVVGLYNAKGNLTATKVELLPRPAPIAAASLSATPAPGATPAASATPAAAASTAAAPAAATAPASGATAITAPAATPPAPK